MSKKKYEWLTLTREQQDLFVRVLWNDGYSENAIAKFFRTTKGRIVVHRQRVLRLPSSGRPAVKSVIVLERFEDLLQIEAMDDMQERGVAVIAPVMASHAPPNPSASVGKTKPVVSLRTKTTLEARPRTKVAAEKKRTCRWPLATGGTLLAPRLCGKEALPGYPVCKDHLAQLLGKRR